MSALKKREKNIEEKRKNTIQDLEKPEARLLRVLDEIQKDASRRKESYLRDSEAAADGE
jgi:prefoldin subunit 5